MIKSLILVKQLQKRAVVKMKYDRLYVMDLRVLCISALNCFCFGLLLVLCF